MPSSPLPAKSNAVARRDETTSVALPNINDLIDRSNLLLRAMKEIMKPGVHFDSIDGDRKFLTKAGGEKLAVLFGLAVECETVESRVTEEEVYFRIRATCRDAHGRILSVQEGACSTGEDKYGWRAASCEEEFQDSEPHRRRVVYKKGKGKAPKMERVQQVRRTAGEQLNTCLQMANKRGSVAAVRSATGASDIFAVPDSGEDLDDQEQPGQPARAYKVAGEGDLRVVAYRDKKSGPDAARPWLLHIMKLSDGREGSTLNADHGRAAERALRDGLAVRAETSPNPRRDGELQIDQLELVPA